MKRTFVTTAATMLLLATSAAFAAGPNDGPKYPTMTSNKQYTDQRIMDHNNAAPRYAVTSNPNNQYTDKRIMDHNNAAPRYSVTASTNQNANATGPGGQRTRVVRRAYRYGPVAAHANRAFGYHG
ncbi:MAG: hypothetical protein JOZ94_23605 [Xanthobacteraceae bacterium]|nr:hypothetical protein [Xanthobacteraceae bacterium]MBV9626752.1 hypothetical protein [Xanthobacteraceae bacterium]